MIKGNESDVGNIDFELQLQIDLFTTADILDLQHFFSVQPGCRENKGIEDVSPKWVNFSRRNP